MAERTPPTPPADRPHEPTRLSRLTETECLELLRKESVGRLAFVVDGWPVVVPVNYAIVGRIIVLRSDEGSKVTAVADRSSVAFEIDGHDVLYQSGWSVLVHATAEEVPPDARPLVAEASRLTSWADGPKTHWIRLTPVQITGRRLARSWEYPEPTPGRHA